MLSMALSIIAGLGSLICMIIVLVRLFSHEGTLQGVLGLFCALYTYAWGWMKQKEHNLMDVMFIWTICILLGIIANLMVELPSFNY